MKIDEKRGYQMHSLPLIADFFANYVGQVKDLLGTLFTGKPMTIDHKDRK